MKRPYTPLTDDDFFKLERGTIVAICAERCELRSMYRNNEMVYLMTGPSGRHVLAAAGTDLNRLNAHWKGFATNPVNAL